MASYILQLELKRDCHFLAVSDFIILRNENGDKVNEHNIIVNSIKSNITFQRTQTIYIRLD